MSGFDDPFWTSRQAVAWIAFQDRELVAATDAAAMQKLRYKDKNGHVRVRRDALAEYVGQWDRTGTIRPKFTAACEKIAMALKAGDIVASYIPDGSRQRVEANRLHWIDNDFYALCPPDAKDIFVEAPHLYQIRFEAEKVRQKWPAASTYAVVKRTLARTAYDVLYEMMIASPGKRPKPKAEILADLMQKTPGLTGRMAEGQWVRAIEDSGAQAWRMPGRPANEP